jgi:hypothetical protein
VGFGGARDRTSDSVNVKEQRVLTVARDCVVLERGEVRQFIDHR